MMRHVPLSTVRRRPGDRPLSRRALLGFAVGGLVLLVLGRVTYRVLHGPGERAASSGARGRTGAEAEGDAVVRPLHAAAGVPLRGCWRIDADPSQPAAGNASAGGSVIPRPRELQMSPGEAPFELSRATKLLAAAAPATLRAAFRQFWLCLFDFRLGEAQEAAADAVSLEHDPALPAEGYRLVVTAALITIAAADRKGVIHALQTLRQLLPPAVFGRSAAQLLPLRVAACRVRDWPRYGWRGVMLDVSRHFFDAGRIRQLILLMSMHKLNVLHLHLSDDQGWRVEVPGHPHLTSIGARRGESMNADAAQQDAGPYRGAEYTRPRFLSAGDLRELVAFAAELGIDMLPEIDLPAHSAALIIAERAAGRELGVVHLHEGCVNRSTGSFDPPVDGAPNCMGGTHGIVVPTEEALSTAADVVRRVAELFPFPYFHLGGDEAGQFRDDAYAEAEARAQQPRAAGASGDAHARSPARGGEDRGGLGRHLPQPRGLPRPGRHADDVVARLVPRRETREGAQSGPPRGAGPLQPGLL
eukprot:TRINITY_DN21654_c0_g1_i3.p1 TRINITY_DN21654_c0_g1~~TRINITY_DN21654_c0_g1_i3.p1  ORF type:complete len:555 (+),score=109.91 TRINITY_DN21654_c0_g1_i3:79-1665(+)